MPGKRLGGKMWGASTELSLAERAVPPNPSEQFLQVGQRSTKSKANAPLLLLCRKPFSPLPALTLQRAVSACQCHSTARDTSSPALTPPPAAGSEAELPARPHVVLALPWGLSFPPAERQEVKPKRRHPPGPSASAQRLPGGAGRGGAQPLGPQPPGPAPPGRCRQRGGPAGPTQRRTKGAPSPAPRSPRPPRSGRAPPR